MIDQSPTLTMLLKQLQRIPYLASKNIFKVAEYFLKLDDEALHNFCVSLKNSKAHIQQCSICFTWKEKDRQCAYCSSTRRDQTTICVVESWHDFIAIERTSGYQGVYHVLGGVICPLEGIGPDELTIKQLIARIENKETSKPCAEIIFAFSQTPEGEATAAYIASKLKQFPVKVSCLARGLPVGSSLESMDRLTVFKALSERRPF